MLSAMILLTKFLPVPVHPCKERARGFLALVLFKKPLTAFTTTLLTRCCPKSCRSKFSCRAGHRDHTVSTEQGGGGSVPPASASRRRVRRPPPARGTGPAKLGRPHRPCPPPRRLCRPQRPPATPAPPAQPPPPPPPAPAPHRRRRAGRAGRSGSTP